MLIKYSIRNIQCGVIQRILEIHEQEQPNIIKKLFKIKLHENSYLVRVPFSNGKYIFDKMVYHPSGNEIENELKDVIRRLICGRRLLNF